MKTDIKKNKHAVDIVATYALSITIICSPPKSRETIPLSSKFLAAKAFTVALSKCLSVIPQIFFALRQVKQSSQSAPQFYLVSNSLGLFSKPNKYRYFYQTEILTPKTYTFYFCV